MRKNWKLIHAVRIYSQDIGMEFGIEKCAMLVTKSGKRHLTDRIELPNEDKIRTLGKKETITWASWKLTSSNKEMKEEKKNPERIFQENQKAIQDKIMDQKLYQKIK